MIKQAEVATMSETGAEGIIQSISEFYTVSELYSSFMVDNIIF